MQQNRTRTLAIAAALMLVAAVALPAAVTASQHSLEIDVDQQRDSGEALVTVTHNDSAVENSTVLVNTSGNYSANESYQTDENGTVLLPNPEETVEVTLTAEYNDSNVTTTETLVPRSESLSVGVEQSAGEPATVTVTQYNDSVENATVNVSLDDENASYAGTGERSTGENGTVELPAPDETVDVTITATSGNLTDETQATLAGLGLAVSAWQGDDGRLYVEVTHDSELVDSATVSVEPVDGNYTYDGEHTADNGTLSLPAPDENLTVNVTAFYDNESTSTEVALDATADDRPENFGQTLVTFIEYIKGQNVDGPLGQEISAFVHENNPAADKANGPPAHVTDENESNPGQGNGPPAHVTDENESSPGQGNGPPAHVTDENESNPGQGNGPPGNVTDDGAETEDGDDRRGPPDHANGNGNASQGNGPF